MTNLQQLRDRMDPIVTDGLDIQADWTDTVDEIIEDARTTKSFLRAGKALWVRSTLWDDTQELRDLCDAILASKATLKDIRKFSKLADKYRAVFEEIFAQLNDEVDEGLDDEM